MSPAPPRAFISYSHDSAEHDERVRALADRLCGDGVNCTIDQYDPHPREPWPRWMERQIEEADFVLVVCTPTYLRRAKGSEPPGVGLGVTFESVLITQDLYDAGMWNEKFIPVLFDGASPQSISKPLRGYARYKLDAEYEPLLRHLRNEPRVRKPEVRPGVPLPPADPPKPSSLYRCMAQPPEGWIHRREYDEVLEALCPKEGAQAGRAVGITTALRGAGGFGKTALAQKLCFDERVREAYPDGILWAKMGEEIDSNGRLRQIRDLILWWSPGEPHAFETVAAAGAKLRESLHGARVLVVVDDVWRPEDVAPFQGLGESCALLITTRDSRTLPADAKPIKVDAMASSEAVDLLRAGLPSSSPEDFRSLAAHLGEWPLLLKLVNGPLREMVNEGLSISEALQEIEGALRTEGFSAFDQSDSASRHAAASRAILVSVRRLPEAEQEFFSQLAIFPEDEDIPISVLERYWGISHFSAARICQHLYDLSLLLDLDRKNGTIRLHDVTRRVLMEQRKGELSSLHSQLLEVYRPASGKWEDLSREESYLWRRLRDHFIGFGGRHEFKALLIRFSFIEAKLLATDINSVIGDYEPFVGEDQELRLIQAALRLSAHVLAEDRSQLAFQLFGRLLERKEQSLHVLLEEARSWRKSAWLRPRTGSLNQAGGALVRTLEGHTEPVLSVAVLSGGRVVSGSFDSTLRVWDLESGQTIRILEGHMARIRAVAVLSDDRIVSGSSDGTLRLWDLESGQALKTLEGHTAGVSAVAVLDDRHAISASDDGTLRVWDLKSGQTLKILEGHAHGVSAVAVLDSRRAVSASADETLRVWDLESGQILKILEGHTAGVSAMAVLDSRRVISGSSDGTLRVWDLESGKPPQTLFLKDFTGWVSALAVLNSHCAVSGSFDQTLRVWDLESGKTLQILQGNTVVSALAVLDGCRAVSGSLDGILQVWDLKGEQTLQTLQGHTRGVRALAVLDGRRAVSGSLDGTLRVWDLKSGQTLQMLQGNTVVSALAALDGRRLVSGSLDGILRVWDLKSGQILQTLQGHTSRVSALAVLDGYRAVFVSTDGMLWVWDLESGQALPALQGQMGGVSALTVLDGRRLVSGSFDGALWVRDLESGQTLQTFQGNTREINGLAVLDDRRIVSGSDDGTLRVWDLESGKVLAIMTLDAPVWSVAATSGGKLILAGDSMGRVHFFDLVEPEYPEINQTRKGASSQRIGPNSSRPHGFSRLFQALFGRR